MMGSTVVEPLTTISSAAFAWAGRRQDRARREAKTMRFICMNSVFFGLQRTAGTTARTSWKIGRLRVKTMTENRNAGDEERFIATELSQSLHVPVTRRN